jgi:hypothetical protein
MYRAFKMMVDNQSVGMDIYRNNGSIWGIITNEKRWVFEFTKDGTLWYNYQFFMGILKFFSINDDGEYRNLITKWFEEKYLNINQVKQTLEISNRRMRDDVEGTIQNGVKHTEGGVLTGDGYVEDTIQNGVRIAKSTIISQDSNVEDTIQNGLKEVYRQKFNLDGLVGEIIDEGVKEVRYNNTEQERKFTEIFGDKI